MSEHIWETDQELLAGLTEALRYAEPSSMSHLAGRAAWHFRDGTRAELAVLTSDSLLHDRSALRDVQGAAARMLTFSTGDGTSMEIELNPDRLLGQVFPGGAGTVSVVAVSGVNDNTETDELGCFSLPLPAGPFRLRFESPEIEFLTDWIRV